MENNSKTEIKATLANEEYGIEAVVARIEAGYSVVVRDADAGEIVPCAIVYATLEAAMAKAREIVA